MLTKEDKDKVIEIRKNDPCQVWIGGCPNLGKHPYNLTPEQVMQIGYNIGSKEEQKSLNN